MQGRIILTRDELDQLRMIAERKRKSLGDTLRELILRETLQAAPDSSRGQLVAQAHGEHTK